MYLFIYLSYHIIISIILTSQRAVHWSIPRAMLLCSSSAAAKIHETNIRGCPVTTSEAKTNYTKQVGLPIQTYHPYMIHIYIYDIYVALHDGDSFEHD